MLFKHDVKKPLGNTYITYPSAKKICLMQFHIHMVGGSYKWGRRAYQ